jgi:hypothetical protein
MVFAKKLRSRIKRGEITTSIRIWRWPHVKQGGRYKLDRGHTAVTSVKEIEIEDITETMAVESGFENVADLLRTAKHGNSSIVYFIEFYYVKGERNALLLLGAMR